MKAMKRKIGLDADELRVESFETEDGEGSRGTIRAYAETDCCTFSCTGTCGAQPASELAALPNTRFNCPTAAPQCCI